jgi:hypothetical protein
MQREARFKAHPVTGRRVAGGVRAAALVCGVMFVACAEGPARLVSDATVDAGDVFDRPSAPPPVDRPTPDVTVFFADEGVPGDACDAAMACSAAPVRCESTERCGDGADDDCDGEVDEGCPCVPGTVRECFAGPPGRRGVGVCHDGAQRCLGVGEFGAWGRCEGGAASTAEVCDHLDNDCDGCVDEGLCCDTPLRCPANGDLRVPDGRPYADYPLRGALFFPGEAFAWRWRVRGGPCDDLLPRPTFELRGSNERDAVFRPTRPGDYDVSLQVITLEGRALGCNFVVHVAGEGLRVELCWSHATPLDLDLFVHDPRNQGPWFRPGGGGFNGANVLNSCSQFNCTAWQTHPLGRADWGHADSPLNVCLDGPRGETWRDLGGCWNPRIDLNAGVDARGVPESFALDAPRDGETFRVMVQNATGAPAHPLVNVYCGGTRRATFGAAPDLVPDFAGLPSSVGAGAMWRVADVRVRVAADGTTGCDVTPLHPPGSARGYDVTRNDVRY